MDKINGAQLILKCLEEEEVEVIFGYPGAAVMPLYDAILDSKIRHILVRHEQGAGHAADGYARATGKTGVCMVTSGPGVTNLITSIANANMDSIPMVAIAGQVDSGLIGTDAFQETDTIGITAPISKHNYLVLDIKELPAIIKEAFYTASTGRPGPVIIDIPSDIMKSMALEKTKIEVEIKGYKPVHKGNLLKVKQAAELISKSKKPVIFAGGGIISSNASDILVKFAEKYQVPVINSLMGLGSFPQNNRLSLGMAGMYGSKYANLVFSKTDLIIAMGTRFDNRVTGKLPGFAPEAKIIHIDIDPAEISKNIIPSVPIVGDVKTVLKDLDNECSRLISKDDINKRDTWLKTIDGFKKDHPLSYDKGSSSLKPGFIIEKIYEQTKGKAIICTEVGQHQMWAAQFYKFDEPRTFISSGGLGTMGFGLPAAIGAKVGRPDMTVIDIAGDGSIQMVMQELATAVINKIPIKVMVLNNGYLGMVRQLQGSFYEGRYSHTDISDSVDFVKLIESFGGIGFRVKKKEDVKGTIQKVLDSDKVALIDFWIDKDEIVPLITGPANSINKTVESKPLAQKSYIISVLVENKTGVLAKVSGLFRRRGYNIESVAVGTTEDEKFSIITMVVSGKRHSIEQVIKQLYKLINVIKIQEMDLLKDPERELVLIKVKANPKNRPEIIGILNVLKAKAIEVSRKALLIEFTGNKRKINTLESMLSSYGILEIVRSGKIACKSTFCE